MMKYLLLSVLVVCMVGVLVIPNAYSDIQYNIKEGTTVDYKVDSICKISVSEPASVQYQNISGVDLESVVKSWTCDDLFQFYRVGPADRYFWDTVSTISVTVLDSSTDGHKFSDGKYGVINRRCINLDFLPQMQYWKKKYTVKIIQISLQKTSLSIVLGGGPEDNSRVDDINKQLDSERVAPASHRSLIENCALISKSRIAIWKPAPSIENCSIT